MPYEAGFADRPVETMRQMVGEIDDGYGFHGD
jgi:hypothetical protein